MSTPEERPDELAGTEQPFVTHLVELRDRLIRAALAVGVCFALLAIWPGPAELYDLLAAPLKANLPPGTTLIATNVISPFLVPLKITLLAAFMLALPVVLYQVWAFVAPGLYSHEKKLVMPLVVSSTLLFFIGVVELWGNAEIGYSQTFKPVEYFAAVAVWYLLLTTIWTFVQSWIERRLAASDREDGLVTIGDRMRGAFSLSSRGRA